MIYYKTEKLHKQQKNSSRQFRKRDHFGKKAHPPEMKKAVSENQEHCGQTSQQPSPD